MKRKSKLRAALIWLLAMAFAVVLVIAGGLWAIDFFKQSPAKLLQGCFAMVGEQKYQLAPDQAENAALISAVGLRRGLPPRAATIAIAVAMQESKIRNISYGDRDSVGMFQQRPSQGWGTVEQIMDPVYSINAFYDGLVKVPDYQNLTITQAGDAVQRSAFPEAYSQHEPMARAFASALSGYSIAALNCTLDAPPAAGVPGEVISSLQSSFGGTGAAFDGTAIRIPASDNAGWSYAHWAVSNAKDLGIIQVTFAGQRWQRANNDNGANRGWQPAVASSSQEVVVALQPSQSPG